MGSKPGPIHKLYTEDENRTTAVCKICGTFLNTTHGHILKRHFMKCYEKNQNKDLDPLIEEVLISIKETPCRKRRRIMRDELNICPCDTPISRGSVSNTSSIPIPISEQFMQINKEGILRDMTLLLTKYELNETFVEDSLLNHLFSSLNPNYNPINRNVIEKKREQMFKKNKTNIEITLKSDMIKYLCVERWVDNNLQEFVSFYIIIPQIGKLCYKLVEVDNMYIYFKLFILFCSIVYIYY